MSLKIILGYCKKAITRPEKSRFPIPMIRTFCRLPIIFDCLSLFFQSRDINRVKKITNEVDGDSHFTNVKTYNAEKTKSKLITTTRRAEILYQILYLYSSRNLKNSKLLIIGPRNIQELFIAWTYGFSWKNINAIDLYSTNRKIKEMNMEDLEYSDGVYDCVTMSNTLAYAKDINKALSEASRVLKPGGQFVFGATYDPENKHLWPETDKTGNEIHSMLNKLSLSIFTCISEDKINATNARQTSHIIGCRKKISDDEFLDPFYL